MRVSITLDFFRSHDHDIDTYRAGQITVDRSSDPIAVELAALDDQKVKVAVRPHGATCRRPKQDDPLRVGGLHDALDDVREDGRVRLAVTFFCFGLHCNEPALFVARVYVDEKSLLKHITARGTTDFQAVRFIKNHVRRGER